VAKLEAERKSKKFNMPHGKRISQYLNPNSESMAITKYIDFLQAQLGDERGKIIREPIVTWLVKHNLLKIISRNKG